MDADDNRRIAVYLIPCSCGRAFAVSEDYDRRGTHLRAFLTCPHCGKRHDPKNRLMQLSYENEGFWKVKGC